MRIRWSMLIGLLFALCSATASAQQILRFEKDHVLDFLYLNNIAGNEQARKQYFKDIGPIGRELGFQPLTAFRIKKAPTQGNYFPDTLAIAAWKGSMKQRMETFDELIRRVPDIQQRRLEIWSTFNMANYYIEEDTALSFFEDKRYVLTSFWQQDDTFSQSIDDYLRAVKQAGGKVMISLENAASIKGYLYAPEYTVITEWQDMASFSQFHNQFKDKMLKSNGVKHINELHLELIDRS